MKGYRSCTSNRSTGYHLLCSDLGELCESTGQNLYCVNIFKILNCLYHWRDNQKARKYCKQKTNKQIKFGYFSEKKISEATWEYVFCGLLQETSFVGLHLDSLLLLAGCYRRITLLTSLFKTIVTALVVPLGGILRELSLWNEAKGDWRGLVAKRIRKEQMTKAGPCTGESGENNFRCKHARQTIQNEPQGVGNTR